MRNGNNAHHFQHFGIHTEYCCRDENLRCQVQTWLHLLTKPQIDLRSGTRRSGVAIPEMPCGVGFVCVRTAGHGFAQQTQSENHSGTR